jgi:hypothetical protein
MKTDVNEASVETVVRRLDDIVDWPCPDIGPVKINKPAIIADFRGCKIVQSGGVFRMHGESFSVSLDPLDALWIIQTLALGATPSHIMRRVVVWENQSDERQP